MVDYIHAILTTGQAQVRDKESDMVQLVQHPDSLLAAPCFQHFETRALEHLLGKHAYQRFILH
ncbi:hypothetical protein HMPREF9946_02601 [Acetobacteraceae bacterium AT-5844]|nr:hypothetical protein HMPREF9946_02601 [Acetobacteraceae bacterium AT-5844]